MSDAESLLKLASASEIDDSFSLVALKSLSDALVINGEATTQEDLIALLKQKVTSAGLDAVLRKWTPGTLSGVRKVLGVQEDDKLKERIINLGLVKFLDPLPEDLLNEMAATLALEEEGKLIMPSILDEIILLGMQSWLTSLPKSTLELWCSDMKINFKDQSDLVDLILTKIFSLKPVLDEVHKMEDLIVPGSPPEEAQQEPTVKIRKDGSEREKTANKPKRKFEEKEESKKPLAKKPKLSEKNEKTTKEKSRKDKEDKESRNKKEKEKKMEKQREQRKITRSRSKSIKKDSESEESEESASKSESEGSGSSTDKRKVKKKKGKEEEQPKNKKKPMQIENIKKGITEDELMKYTISDYRKFANEHDIHLTGNKPDMTKKIIAFLEGVKKKEEKEKKEDKKDKKPPTKKNNKEKI